MEKEVNDLLRKSLFDAMEMSREEIRLLCREYLNLVGSGERAINGFVQHRRLVAAWKAVIAQIHPKIVIHKSHDKVYLLIQFADPDRLDALTPVIIKRNMEGDKYQATTAKYKKGGWWRYFEFGTSGDRNFESEKWGFVTNKSHTGGFMARANKPSFIYSKGANDVDENDDESRKHGRKKVIPRPHPGVRKHSMFRVTWLYWRPIFIEKLKKVIQNNFNKAVIKNA